MDKFTEAQIAVVQEFLNHNITKAIAIKILTQDIFDAILHELAKPLPVVEKVRPWDTFYLTIVKIPNNSVVVPTRWSVYGAVEDNEGKIVHLFSTLPGSKMVAIGRFKGAMEAIFGESDLKRGGDLRQLSVLDSHPLVDKDVIIHKQIFGVPWVRIQRKPVYSIAIGSIAEISVVEGLVSISSFNNNDIAVIENRSRTSCVEGYAKLVGHMQSIDTTPLFQPLHEEWKKIIAKRQLQISQDVGQKPLKPREKDNRRKKNIRPLGPNGEMQ